MRLPWVLVLVFLVVSGCKSGKDRAAQSDGEAVFGYVPSVPKRGIKAAAGKMNPAQTSRPAVAPARAPTVPVEKASTPAVGTRISRGKVISLNGSLRFMVIDFALDPVPGIGSRVEVYRQGQKAAEGRVTGPQRESVTAADITLGEVQVGDEARAPQ